MWLKIVLLCVLLLLQLSAGHAFRSAPTRRCHAKPAYGLSRSQRHKSNRGVRSHWDSPHLQAAVDPVVVSSSSTALKILSPVVAGGLLSGALHAITGPDHIAALLPSSLGSSTLTGVKNGALWGIGHGISATLLGFCAFFLKDKISAKFFDVEKLTSFAESAVGVSLVAIGLLGIKESLDKDEHEEEHSTNKKGSSSRSLFFNGLLHGFSLDGAPSIAPAVVMSNWQNAAFYLVCYSLGTTIAMSIASAAIATLSTRLGKLANQPDLPKKLSLFSSAAALLIGLYWVLHPLVFH